MIKQSFIVAKVKQRGKELIAIDSNAIGYQYSANLYIELDLESASTSPFSTDMVKKGICRPAGNKELIECPIIVESGKTYLLLPDKAFEYDGEIKISYAGITADKHIVNTNLLSLHIDESNRIATALAPPEEYWEISVKNAMELWFSLTVKPQYDEIRTKLEQAESARVLSENERKAQETQRQNDTKTAIDRANQASLACEGLAKGVYTMIDDVTKLPYMIGVENGLIYIKEVEK